MFCQSRFISCNRYALWWEMLVMGMACTMWEKKGSDKSLPASLFYCGPKMPLKINSQLYKAGYIFIWILIATYSWISDTFCEWPSALDCVISCYYFGSSLVKDYPCFYNWISCLSSILCWPIISCADRSFKNLVFCLCVCFFATVVALFAGIITRDIRGDNYFFILSSVHFAKYR